LWDTLCTFTPSPILHPSFMFSSSSKLLPSTSQSLDAGYQLSFISQSFFYFLTALVFVSEYRGRHIIIVSRSECEYFVSSVFDTEARTFHEMYIVHLVGWMDGRRCIYCVSLLFFFFTIGPTCFLKQRYFSTGQNSCSSLYSMLYNILFSKKSSPKRETSSIRDVQ